MEILKYCRYSECRGFVVALPVEWKVEEPKLAAHFDCAADDLHSEMQDEPPNNPLQGKGEI